MKKSIFNPSEALEIFWAAPESAVFDQKVTAVVVSLSPSSLERARWAGFGGPPFIKMGRSVRYRKSDILVFLSNHTTFQSTTEVQYNTGGALL